MISLPAHLRRPLLLSIPITLAVTGCSLAENLKKDEPGAEDSDAKPAAVDCPQGKDCASEPQPATGTGTDTVDETTSFGLAGFCDFKLNDKGEGCFSCKPRELPVVQCRQVAEGFDPAKACTHDLDRMECDLGTGDTFGWEFTEPTNDEKVYGRIPLLVFGAKAVLASRLKDAPATMTLVNKALDLILTHRQAMFVSGDLGVVADAIAALVKEADSSVTDQTLTSVKEAALRAMTEMRTKRLAGTLTDGDILTLIQGLLKSMPAGLVNGFGVDLNIQQITENLKKSGSEQYLIQFLAMFGAGGGSLDDLLKQLGSSP